MRTPRIWLLILAAVAMSAPLAAQDFRVPNPGRGRITDTVIDVNNDIVSGATVVLEGSVLRDPRTVVSDENGFFEFNDLDPGTYNVTISVKGFANWTSPAVVVEPGQYVILTAAKLKIADALTTVSVTYSPEQVATEQVKIAEQQRVFRIIPNFYVVYDHDAVPLTTKLKFQLALKTAVDPVTVIGTGLLAAINQAGDTPDYGQGMQGYGKRVGAIAADGISNIMIGGAILSRSCTRTRAISTRAQARRHLAFSTRSPAQLSAGETTGGYSPTTPAWVAIWPRSLCRTPTIRHRIAALEWSSRIS